MPAQRTTPASRFLSENEINALHRAAAGHIGQWSRVYTIFAAHEADFGERVQSKTGRNPKAGGPGARTIKEVALLMLAANGDVPVGVPVGQSSEALRKEVALKRAELRAAELRLQLHELGASGPASPAA